MFQSAQVCAARQVICAALVSGPARWVRRDDRLCHVRSSPMCCYYRESELLTYNTEQPRRGIQVEVPHPQPWRNAWQERTARPNSEERPEKDERDKKYSRVAKAWCCLHRRITLNELSGLRLERSPAFIYSHFRYPVSNKTLHWQLQ
jgi:hypothetical protein